MNINVIYSYRFFFGRELKLHPFILDESTADFHFIAEKTDFAGLETIIKRKENLAKRSMEAVGIQGGRKRGNQ